MLSTLIHGWSNSNPKWFVIIVFRIGFTHILHVVISIYEELIYMKGENIEVSRNSS